MIMQSALDERPVEYADRVGRWYVAHASPERRKTLGQYFTPAPIAEFMAGKLESVRLADCVRILDPAAGSGVLAAAACEALAAAPHKPTRIVLTVYEIDADLIECLSGTLCYVKDWLLEREIVLESSIHAADFVLENAARLRPTVAMFSPADDFQSSFDVIIANPPYFKIAKQDPRAVLAAPVVYGQPNIYSLFMAIAAELLDANGQVVFITPRSYASGLYFELFRKYFFRRIRPTAIHVFDSRREAFDRDSVLQENMILWGRRGDASGIMKDTDYVQLSSSAGLIDLHQPSVRMVPLHQIVGPVRDGCVLQIPGHAIERARQRLVRGWTGSLHKYGMEVSTGPVVAFRAKHLMSAHGEMPETHAPLLWMQHVTSMSVAWPMKNVGKDEYIAVTPDAKSVLVPNRNYVVMRRFSAKEEQRRIVAAPYFRAAFAANYIGLENHLNFIRRLNGELSDEEICGLAALLNSSMVDEAFREISGNTQVSATELRKMPLPSLEAIVEIGRSCLAPNSSLARIDELVLDVLGRQAL